MNPANANSEIFQLFKDGVKVAFRKKDDVIIETKKFARAKANWVYSGTLRARQVVSMIFYAMKVLSNLPVGKL